MYIYICIYTYIHIYTCNFPHMSHIGMRHVAHRKGSCHTSGWVTSQLRISHVTFICDVTRTCTHWKEPWSREALVPHRKESCPNTNGSCQVYMCTPKGAMVPGSTCMNALCPTYERVMSQYKWVMSRIYVYTPEGAMVPDSTGSTCSYI